MALKLAKRAYLGGRWDWIEGLGGRTLCAGCLFAETSGFDCIACGLFLHCLTAEYECVWCAEEKFHGP